MAAADERERKSTLRDYYEALLIAVVFVNFARIFAFQPFKIPSGSMEDNLKIGDHIFVNKFIYGPRDRVLSRLLPLRDVERGDVIVFRYPEQPEIDYVKRVIALPGETLIIRDKKVFIDGRELSEPYVVFTDQRTYPGGRATRFLPEPQRSRDHYGPFVVPAGQYFAMGDNRDESYDSRYWGPVSRALIKGRAFIVYWSFDMAPATSDSPRERLRELGRVVLYFFTKTRWHRTGFVIDSKYHYTPGVSRYGNH